MTSAATHATTDPGICAVCRRRHDNLAYAPTPRHPLKWVCAECVPLAKGIYHMPRAQIDEFERKALNDAGEAAGAYLDEIGKTDLADLTEEEWAAFWERGLMGYSESMKEQATKLWAPF